MISTVIETPTIPSALQMPPLSAMHAALHFREKILFIRKTLQISVSEMARRLGVAPYNVWDWENLRANSPANVYVICAINEWEAALRKLTTANKETRSIS